MPPTSAGTSPVIVQLIDSASGRAAQVWKFDAACVVSIGRAPERDVCLADPYVSRHHADLSCRDGQWWLIPISKNGVLVNGRAVAETPLGDETVFRLGTSGPVLRFSSASATLREQATLAGLDADAVFVPTLDTAKRDDEVRGITESEYFQQLQKRARDLRQQRETK